MSKHKKLLIGGLLAALLLTLIPLAVFAQGGPPLTDAPSGDPAGLWRALTDTAAQALNMEPGDFVQALREGRTPAELAQEADVSTDELAAALQATWNAQGEAIIARFIENGVPPKHPNHPPSPRTIFKRTRAWVKISAETLDMPMRDFVGAMREGQTPAQIAEARGRSGQVLTDAILQAEKARLDQAVAAGRIDQERADAILARVAELAGKWVENGFRKPPRQRP
ncbi:MAG TPA: hypothetical protein EYP25_08355 [Anaerolineae bacterium]|nr:hypothetical protein [Caldilineae bacterium]HID34562.1 hypothetical protein [Anaerolineae bacterium]